MDSGMCQAPVVCRGFVHLPPKVKQCEPSYWKQCLVTDSGCLALTISHSYVGTYAGSIRQRPLSNWIICLDIRITFEKEKRGHLCCLQLCSTIFESPSTKRNEHMYDVFRYPHPYSNHFRWREQRTFMLRACFIPLINTTFIELSTTTYLVLFYPRLVLRLNLLTHLSKSDLD